MRNIASVFSNCTNFFSFGILKIIFLLSTAFCFSACQTVQYHDPIQISQDEIKTMTTLDEHGRSQPPAAGQIKDCATMKSLGEKTCAYIICKDDKTQATGLSCEYHVPKTDKTAMMVASSGKFSTKDQGLENQIKSFVADFEAGKKTKLETFCNLDTVVCYFKAKPFPLSKSPSSAKLATLIHKESSTMNGESLEVSVFKD